MKTPKFAFIAVALCLVSLFSQGSAQQAAPFPSDTIAANAPGLTITANYPVTGNAAVDTMTRAHIDRLIKDAKELYNEPDGSATTIEITYEEFRLNKDVVSFLYTQYANTEGAAYPILSFSATSFNLAQGKRIGLNDVLQGDPSTMLALPVRDALKEELGEEVYNQLDRDALNEALSFDSAYETFALTPDALLIQLQEGLIGPHALGAPRLTIPYNEINVNPWVLRK